MPRLLDAHGLAIRLHLVDISPFDPNGLALHDGLLNNDRLSNHSGLLKNDRLGHDRRRRLHHDSFRIIRPGNRATNRPADHATDKPRPEIPTAWPPVSAVVMMMVVATMPSVMDRRRTMEPSMMRSAMPATGERSCRYRRKSDYYYEFLHRSCPFSVCE